MASQAARGARPSRLRAATAAFATNWRNPELRRAQAAFFGAGAAEWAVTVVLAVYAYGRGGATEVGVVALVRVLPSAVVAPLATQYADRWPREKVLVAVSLVRSVSIAIAAWAVFVDGPALTVYALATLSSAAAVLFRDRSLVCAVHGCGVEGRGVRRRAGRTVLGGGTIRGLRHVVAVPAPGECDDVAHRGLLGVVVGPAAGAVRVPSA